MCVGGDILETKKRDRININVNSDFKELVIKKADEMGISVSAYIIIAVNEYIKQNSVTDLAIMFKELEKKMKVVESD